MQTLKFYPLLLKRAPSPLKMPECQSIRALFPLKPLLLRETAVVFPICRQAQLKNYIAIRLPEEYEEKLKKE